MSRSIWSYSKVQRFLAAALRNRRLQLAFMPERPLLNIGCGHNVQPGFINVDYQWNPGIHLCWDLRVRLPLSDASAVGIFTEHCLEHVTYDECLAALHDMFRILKPGGVLRAIVPDAGLYLDLYQRHCRGEKVAFPYVDDQGQIDLAVDSRFGFTPMMAVNRIFRGYGHMFAYDYDTIRNLLLQAGFRDVVRCRFQEGQLPALLIDSDLRAPQSLIVEAVR